MGHQTHKVYKEQTCPSGTQHTRQLSRVFFFVGADEETMTCVSYIKGKIQFMYF